MSQLERSDWRCTRCGALESKGGCEHDFEAYYEEIIVTEHVSQSGASLIAAERERQMAEEGWTAEHDDQHDRGELAAAAQCYINTAGDRRFISPHWPWDESWWKPSGDRVRDLTKAGALIAAEIDRIQRRG